MPFPSTVSFDFVSSFVSFPTTVELELLAVTQPSPGLGIGVLESNGTC